MKKVFIAIISLSFIFTSSVKFAGTVDDSNGDIAFTNTNNAKAEDGSFATIAVAGIGLAEDVHYSNFGFAIPSTATIVDFQFSIKAKVDDATTESYEDLVIYGNSTAAATGDGQGYYSTSLAWVDGRVYTKAEIDALIGTVTYVTVNASDFGFEILNTDADATTFSVDAGKITVNYTDVSGTKKRIIGYGGKTETQTLINGEYR